MKRTLLALRGLTREPQNWINLIGVGAMLALVLGAFEPADAGRRQASLGAGASEAAVQVASVTPGREPGSISSGR